MTTLAYAIAGLVVFGCALTAYTCCVVAGRQMNNSSACGASLREVRMFEVGQKVVCVDGSPAKKASFWHPKNGSCYTIKDVGSGPDGDWVDLCEDPNPNDKSAWRPERFRPLRPNEADARESWAEMLKKPYLADEVRAALNAGECGDWLR